jgi:tight adherence protein B
VAGALVALAGLAGLALPAAAQSEGSGPAVALRSVDASDDAAVDVVFSNSREAGAVDGLELRENGDVVDATVAPLADTSHTNDIVFVVDSSSSTDADALLTNVRDVLGDFVADLPAGTQVGIVTAGSVAQTLERLTTDTGRLQTAIDNLTPDGESGLLAGVTRAAGMLDAASPGSVPTVVLFTDGVEDPTVTVDRAAGALEDVGASLYVNGLQAGKLDEGGFADLARRSGGSAVVTEDPEAVPDLFDALRPTITNLFSATYPSSEAAGVQDLILRIGDAGVRGSYVSGSLLVGAERLGPRDAVKPGGISWLHGDLGKYLGFGAALAAAILLAYAIFLLAVREDTGLSAVLRPYSDGYVAAGEDDDEDGESDGAFAPQTALLQRAVAMTGTFAERQGFLTKIETQLEKADLPLRAAEAIFFYLAGAVLVTFLSLVLTQNLLGMIVIGGFAFLIPPAVLSVLSSRKKKAFEAMLPDTLQLLSSTLRAGYSMMQGVEAVSQETAEPMGKELRRVVTEARLGRPLEESLDAVAERMGSNDFAWAVMAIRIQREVGGNLSELLLTVAETMTERERLRRDINSLTAEGRVSAYVLAALPIGLGIVLFGMNPDYMGKLFEETIGQIALGIAILMAGVGFLWMNKIIKIEI